MNIKQGTNPYFSKGKLQKTFKSTWDKKEKQDKKKYQTFRKKKKKETSDKHELI